MNRFKKSVLGLVSFFAWLTCSQLGLANSASANQTILTLQEEMLQLNFYDSQLSFYPIKKIGFSLDSSYSFMVKENKKTQIKLEGKTFNIGVWRVSVALGPVAVEYRSIDLNSDERTSLGIANFHLQIPLINLENISLGVGGLATGFKLPDDLNRSASFAGVEFKKPSPLNFLNRLVEKLDEFDWHKRFREKNPFKKYSVSFTLDLETKFLLWENYLIELNLFNSLNFAHSMSYLELNSGVRSAYNLQLTFTGEGIRPNISLYTGLYFSSSLGQMKDSAVSLYKTTQQAIKEKKASLLFSKGYLQKYLEHFDELGFIFQVEVDGFDLFSFHLGYKLAYFPKATPYENKFNFGHAIAGRFAVTF